MISIICYCFVGNYFVLVYYITIINKNIIILHYLKIYNYHKINNITFVCVNIFWTNNFCNV